MLERLRARLGLGSSTSAQSTAMSSQSRLVEANSSAATLDYQTMSSNTMVRTRDIQPVPSLEVQVESLNALSNAILEPGSSSTASSSSSQSTKLPSQTIPGELIRSIQVPKQQEVRFNFGSFSMDNEYEYYTFPDLEAIKKIIPSLEKQTVVIQGLSDEESYELFYKIHQAEIKHYAAQQDELKHRHYFHALVAEKLFLALNGTFEGFNLYRFYDLSEEYVEDCFKKAATSGNVQAAIHLGDKYWQKREYEKAAAWYQQVVEKSSAWYQQQYDEKSLKTISKSINVIGVLGYAEFIRLAKQFYEYVNSHPGDRIINPLYLVMMEPLLTISGNFSIQDRLDLAILVRTMPSNESNTVWNRMNHVSLALHHATQGFYQCHSEGKMRLLPKLREQIEENVEEYIERVKAENQSLQEIVLASSFEDNDIKTTEISHSYYKSLLQMIENLSTCTSAAQTKHESLRASLKEREDQYKQSSKELDMEEKEKLLFSIQEIKEKLKVNKKKINIVNELCEVAAMLPGMLDYTMSLLQPSEDDGTEDAYTAGAKLFLKAVIAPGSRLPLMQSERNKIPQIKQVISDYVNAVCLDPAKVGSSSTATSTVSSSSSVRAVSSTSYPLFLFASNESALKDFAYTSELASENTTPSTTRSHSPSKLQ